MLIDFFQNRRHRKGVIGIDIQPNQVKLTLIKQYKTEYVLQAFSEANIPRTKDGVVTAISESYTNLNTSIKDAAIALPNSSVILKIITIDNVVICQEELEELILLKAEQHISFPLNEISLDFQLIDTSVDAKKINVLLVATRTETITHFKEMITRAGLDLKIVEVESVVIHNLFKFILGAKHPEQIDMLSEQINIQTSINPFEKIKIASHLPYDKITAQSSTLLLSCGLSMRGLK
jgi:type IV pilus assembly protein PilM